MLSAVLIALYPAIPASPATAPHTAGATTPSEKFSAKLSIAARTTPASSNRSGSRPTMCDTARRPSANPSCSSAPATAFTN